MKKSKMSDNTEEPIKIPQIVPIFVIGEVISITDKKEGNDHILFSVTDSKKFELGKKYEIKAV